jgi:myo-inositol-1(or 4)-monophosphatase
MDKAFRERLFNQAKEWIREAGAHIRTNIHEPLAVDTKSNPNDLVTAMDKETEAYFASKIRGTYPEHFILSEEGFGDELDSLNGTVWIIDPIDGTMNFVHQKRNFAISIGIFHHGAGEIGLIYDVMNDVLYSAKRGEGAYKGDIRLPPLKAHINLEEAMLGLNHFWLCENRLTDEKVMQQLVKRVRGTRTFGSAALEFAFVAEGIMDGYLTMSLAPWDVAAGIVIVNEVGGITTDMDGNELGLLKKSSVITCNPSIQQFVIQDYLQKAKK